VAEVRVICRVLFVCLIVCLCRISFVLNCKLFDKFIASQFMAVDVIPVY